MATELSEPFNRKACPIVGYEQCWVEFKTSGYPRKLRRLWDETKDADATLEIVLSYITAWSLVDVNGAAIELGRTAAVLDNAEDAVAVWLVRAFQMFWLIELQRPPKN